MKLTVLGILLCLVAFFLMIEGKGTNIYAVGGYLFFFAIILAFAGLLIKWDKKDKDE